MILSPQQDKVLREVEAWSRSPSAPQVFRLFGFAGTGKTTIAQILTQHIKGLTLFAAYTGKAASVLRKRGAPDAQTLHSILYSVNDRDQTRLRKLQAEWKTLYADPDADPELLREVTRELQEETKLVRAPHFSVNPESILRDAELLVLDECSMVGKREGTDALSFGKKVLVLGDPAQLPPVQGGGFFTNQKPDFLLTEIHRQAADNPIIRWASIVREGGTIPFGRESDDCWKMPKKNYGSEWYASEDAGQLLTGMNESRRKLNTAVRKARGIPYLYPQANEKLVVLRNDRDIGVLNGVVCTTLEDSAHVPEEDYLSISINYEGFPIYGVPVQMSIFDGYRDPTFFDHVADRNLMQMDYGYALTVHKSQGSQWPTVTLCDDGFWKREPLNRRRWLYTAITRAESRLRIVV